MRFLASRTAHDIETYPEKTERAPGAERPAEANGQGRRHLVEIALIFCAVAGFVYLTGWFAYATFGVPAGSPTQLIHSVYDRWDALNYILIAEHGYAVSNYHVVWFPVLPTVMRVGAWTGLSPLFVGTVFVLGSTLVAALVLYYLVRLDHPGTVGRDAAFFLLIFPSSLFLYVPYTEAVLVMLAIGSFYLARKGHWALACAAAGLGSAVRNPGIFIGPALAVEYLAVRGWDWRKIRPDALWLLLAPAGIVAYMVYLQVEFGDALAFYHWQLNSVRLETIATRGGIPDFIPSLVDSVRVIFITESMDELVGNAAGLASILFFLALLPLMFLMRIRLSYIVFSALAVLTPLFTGRLVGANRFVLAAFPMFIVLALLGERYRALRTPWIVASLSLLQVSAVRFATYHWAG